ncbi:hypothetical protein HanIR_Chr08g0375401 [Helianthus annuus]|nr:hypothetical protein HanIR_Chr08g0375401 [Helianthus annuus]
MFPSSSPNDLKECDMYAITKRMTAIKEMAGMDVLRSERHDHWLLTTLQLINLIEFIEKADGFAVVFPRTQV